MIDSFGKFGSTIPLKTKNTQTIRESFENLLLTSKRKTNLIETDGGKELYNSIFQTFQNNNNVKHYSRSASVGALFAQRLIRTSRNLLKRLVFLRGDGKWIDVLPTKTNQFEKRIHPSIKLTPTQASLEKNEGFVYENVLNKQKKTKQGIKFTISLEQQI